MKDMNVYTVNVRCPGCGKESQFTMHTLIDTARDPRALNKLFSGEYFTHVCPICKTVRPVTYSCMYHDGSNKVLIGFADSEKDYAEMKESLSGERKNDKLDEVLSQWLSTSEVRIVRSEYALQEKALISYLGLDDRIIEIARYQEMKKLKETRNDVLDLLFNTEGEERYFLIVTEEGIQDKILFTNESYQSIQQRYKDILENNEEQIIDLDWVSKIVEE